VTLCTEAEGNILEEAVRLCAAAHGGLMEVPVQLCAHSAQPRRQLQHAPTLRTQPLKYSLDGPATSIHGSLDTGPTGQRGALQSLEKSWEGNPKSDQQYLQQ
jgi:hypothetical protein